MQNNKCLIKINSKCLIMIVKIIVIKNPKKTKRINNKDQAKKSKAKKINKIKKF